MVRLTARKSSGVEAHLAECAECRAELEAEERLAAAVASTPLDCDSGWENMQRRMEGEVVAGSSPARTVAQTHPGRAGRSPVRWPPQRRSRSSSSNITPRQPVEPQYRALGAAPTAQPGEPCGAVRARYACQTSRTLLGSVDARVVDGPTATGAYLLHVDGNKRELALKRLRDNQAIALAEPIDEPARE